MPNPREHPVFHVAVGASFPEGPFRRGTPREVYLASALAQRLNKKIGDESIRYIAKKADLSPQTILNILNGKTWPDLRTIARLENAVNGRLWGAEHRQHREDYRSGHTLPPVWRRW